MRARAARDKGRSERAQRATAFRASLVGQLRGSGAPLTPAVEALLDSATSAYVEIAKTSAQFIEGRASAKAMERMSNARGELRRTLRSLGLIANGGEAGTNGDSAPPPGAPSDESMAEVVASFGGTPQGGR